MIERLDQWLDEKNKIGVTRIERLALCYAKNGFSMKSQGWGTKVGNGISMDESLDLLQFVKFLEGFGFALDMQANVSLHVIERVQKELVKNRNSYEMRKMRGE